MSLFFGDKCVRCGKKRTRKTFEGLPTCAACELAIRAEREQKRYCPVDGSNMTKQVVQNVIVDRCPFCGGVWLDGGELDLIKQASGDEQFCVGLATAIASGSKKPEAP
jgi:hypothetical protein